jgi:hypothetical protein
MRVLALLGFALVLAGCASRCDHRPPLERVMSERCTPLDCWNQPIVRHDAPCTPCPPCAPGR